MRILGLLALLVSSKFVSSVTTRNYVKVLKIEFNQTGTTCKNPYVRLRTLSRYDTAVDAGCDLQRTIYGGFMNLKFWIKTPTSTNYRQTVELKNIEPCKIMANRKWFPPVNYLFDRARELYPQYVHDCPYSEFKIENLTAFFINDLTEDDKKWAVFPNGIHRIHVKVWDDTGDEGHIMIWAEAKFHHRTLTPSDLLWSGNHVFG